jgi:release factor glutamine methyltransferase
MISSVMLVNTWLRSACKKLESSNIGTARLDALLLLEFVTYKERAWLLAHPEFELSAAQVAKLEKLLNRRVQHEPLAYIRGSTEFYGRDFVITPAVLEPRPESETMIDMLKTLPRFDHSVRLADVGTGSGALGITAKLELPNLDVDLLEIDPKAIKVAKTNVDKFTLSINVIKSDLLKASTKDYDILLCNLPYVPDDYQINLAAGHEPRLAIFGGKDGIELYRQLFAQVSQLTKQPLYILTEALPPQHPALALLAQTAGYSLFKSDDFIQCFKCTLL